MTAPAPEISVVIPTFNRAGRLRAGLDALVAQTLDPSQFEVIVVVDGSTDGTVEMLEGLSPPFALRVVVQQHANWPTARNRGAEAASGRYLLHLDDDMAASSGLVAQHLAAQHEHGGAVVIGPCIQMLQKRASRFARCRAEERLAHYRALREREPVFTDAWSGNLSLPRDLHHGVGGFAPRSCVDGDTEFAFRLDALGARFVFAEDAVAYEDERESPVDLIQDAEDRGATSLDLWRRQPAVVSAIELGGAGELTRGWLVLRRGLLALHVPPRVIEPIGRSLPSSWSRAWYRFLWSYCYWRGVRSAADRDTWRGFVRGTPILMYHAVGGPGERPSRFVIPRRRLERQLRWLKARGYRAIPLEELVRCRLDHRLPPPKSVVVTFDDGYEDNRRLAVPLLERLGVPATIFVVTAGGDSVTWGEESDCTGRPLMPLSAVAELSSDLIAIGAHTRTHPDLTSLDGAALDAEIAGSRADLEAVLGAPVRIFAYPYGRWSPEAREAAIRAGYHAACSVASGRNRFSIDPYRLRRLEVRGTDSLLRFALTLLLGDTRSILRAERR